MRDTITVKGRSGETRTVVAEKRVGELALHKTLARGAGWTITHVPTGLRACSVPRREDAELLLKKFRRLDWKFRSPKSRKIRAIYPKVKRAMEQVTGKWRTIQTVI